MNPKCYSISKHYKNGLPEYEVTFSEPDFITGKFTPKKRFFATSRAAYSFADYINAEYFGKYLDLAENLGFATKEETDERFAYFEGEFWEELFERDC